jgi:hypothetical protein
MGFNLQWLAVKNKDTKIVLKNIGLKPLGQYEELPESDFNGIEINDWYLVSNNFVKYFETVENQNLDDVPMVKECSVVYKHFTDEMIKDLSKNCEIVRFDASEYKMFSKVDFWEDGKNIWSVLHDYEYGKDHISIEGNPPEILNSIVNKFKKKQDEDREGDVDYIYEIPVELAKEVVGYRYDEDVDGEGEQWEMLARNPKRDRISLLFQVVGICLFFFYVIKYFYTKLYH